MRVPADRGRSLARARAEGADVCIVYSPLDALEVARQNPSRTVIFLGVGFETTAPMVASAIFSAEAEGIRNFAVFSTHKLTPPAMRAILDAGEVRLSGIIGPGHVTTIIGPEAWQFLPREYGVPCAVTGFEPLDILRAILALGIREEYARYDAVRLFPVEVPPAREPPGCRCGDVLRGVLRPVECPLFARVCTPQSPVGPCMVSAEGTCAAYYQYGRPVPE